MATANLKIVLGNFPNYLRVETGARSSSTEKDETATISVAMLSLEEINQYIEEWSDGFRAHVMERKRLREQDNAQ